MGSRLKFTIPEDGFAATPIVTAGGVHVEPDEDLYAVEPVGLVIDASAFKGDSQTLIKTATDSTTAFQRLIDNVEFVGKKRGEFTPQVAPCPQPQEACVCLFTESVLLRVEWHSQCYTLRTERNLRGGGLVY